MQGVSSLPPTAGVSPGHAQLAAPTLLRSTSSQEAYTPAAVAQTLLRGPSFGQATPQGPSVIGAAPDASQAGGRGVRTAPSFLQPAGQPANIMRVASEVVQVNCAPTAATVSSTPSGHPTPRRSVTPPRVSTASAPSPRLATDPNFGRSVMVASAPSPRLAAAPAPSAMNPFALVPAPVIVREGASVRMSAMPARSAAPAAGPASVRMSGAPSAPGPQQTSSSACFPLHAATARPFVAAVGASASAPGRALTPTTAPSEPVTLAAARVASSAPPAVDHLAEQRARMAAAALPARPEGPRIARSLTPRREALSAAGAQQANRASPAASPDVMEVRPVASPVEPVTQLIMPGNFRPLDEVRVSQGRSPLPAGPRRAHSPAGSETNNIRVVSPSQSQAFMKTTPLLPLQKPPSSPPGSSPYAAAALQPPAAWELLPTEAAAPAFAQSSPYNVATSQSSLPWELLPTVPSSLPMRSSSGSPGMPPQRSRSPSMSRAPVPSNLPVHSPSGSPGMPRPGSPGMLPPPGFPHGMPPHGGIMAYGMPPGRAEEENGHFMTDMGFLSPEVLRQLQGEDVEHAGGMVSMPMAGPVMLPPGMMSPGMMPPGMMPPGMMPPGMLPANMPPPRRPSPFEGDGRELHGAASMPMVRQSSPPRMLGPPGVGALPIPVPSMMGPPLMAPMAAPLGMPYAVHPGQRGVPDFFIGTPNLLRSAETVPGVTSHHSSPPPSLTMLPEATPSMAAPITPRTAPASPSMAAPRSSVPMVVERRLGSLPHPDPGMIPHEASLNLAQEVAVRDVELHVLREEVGARDVEAEQLRMKLRDASAKQEDASGELETMSVEVGTSAGNRHAVLRASCVQSSAKVQALQARLRQAEEEVAEKDIEIQVLRQAVAEDEKYVQVQREELGDLTLGHQEQGEKARWLAQHQDGLRRKAAIDVWHDGVQARIEQEQSEVAEQRQRQAAAEQMEQLSKETAAMRTLIVNLEHKQQLAVAGIQEQKKKYDELVMEARLSESGSKMGQEAAYEQAQSQKAELQGLEARLAAETSRKQRALGASQAYSQHESEAMRHMTELISLTECMRKVTSVLRETGLSMHKDPIQRAVDEEVMLLHHIEDQPSAHVVVPPPGMRPPMSGSGRGRSRSASPGPAGREAMGGMYSPGPMGRPRLPSTPRSRSPMPQAPSTAFPPSFNATGPGSWGMPALVAPITIGGAM